MQKSLVNRSTMIKCKREVINLPHKDSSKFHRQTHSNEVKLLDRIDLNDETKAPVTAALPEKFKAQTSTADQTLVLPCQQKFNQLRTKRRYRRK